jgi:hypothetical protein
MQSDGVVSVDSMKPLSALRTDDEEDEIAMTKPSVDEVEAMIRRIEEYNYNADVSIDLLDDCAAMLRSLSNERDTLRKHLQRLTKRCEDLSVDATQRHDLSGPDAQRNSQDGNSVVLSADEWDAYRADLNTYSQILSTLGMEEEGDPVLAVKLLMQVKHD